MKNLGLYIAISIIFLLVCIAIAAAISFILSKKKKNEEEPITNNGGDLETQQLGLSIRTASDKKGFIEIPTQSGYWALCHCSGDDQTA
ncbi:hypothetical protein OROHE_001145 [Orobanche hederae]